MVFTPTTLAKRWGVSRQLIYAMINKGELRAFKLGAKLYRIHEEDVLQIEARQAFTPSDDRENSKAEADDFTVAVRLARLVK